MKSLVTITAICSTLFLVVGLAAFTPQLRAPNPTPNPAPPQNPPSASKTYQGQLSKVDMNAKTIIVRGVDEKEMTFIYSDETEMVGIENSPQALNGKAGSNLKVTYRESLGRNVAMKIEVVQKQPAEP